MRIALSTGSLYTYGIERAFALAAEAGFGGMEILVDNRWDTRQVAYLGALVDRFALPIVSLHTPFSWRMDGWESGQIRYLKHTAELARGLGVSVVVVHLPARWRELSGNLSEPFKRINVPLLWPREPRYDRWLLHELPRFEAETGLRIAVENMPLSQWGRWRLNRYRLNDGVHLSQHVMRYPHLTMDTTHLGTWGADVLGFYEMAKERIVNIHLSNYAEGKEHRLPWEGELPLADLVRRLRRDEYAGNLVAEMSPDALGAQDAKEVLSNFTA